MHQTAKVIMWCTFQMDCRIVQYLCIYRTGLRSVRSETVNIASNYVSFEKKWGNWFDFFQCGFSWFLAVSLLYAPHSAIQFEKRTIDRHPATISRVDHIVYVMQSTVVKLNDTRSPRQAMQSKSQRLRERERVTARDKWIERAGAGKLSNKIATWSKSGRSTTYIYLLYLGEMGSDAMVKL